MKLLFIKELPNVLLKEMSRTDRHLRDRKRMFYTI